MPSVFTKIVNGEIPCYKVAEDDNHLAFLDIRPLQKGHTLVIPKQEIDYIFDIKPESLSQLHLFAQKVAIAIEKVIKCERIGLTVMGLEVPHAHIHLIPMNRMSDMSFTNDPLNLTSEEFVDIAQKISESFLKA